MEIELKKNGGICEQKLCRKLMKYKNFLCLNLATPKRSIIHYSYSLKKSTTILVRQYKKWKLYF